MASGQCTPPYTEGECSPLDTGNWGAQGFEYHPVNCVTWPQAEEFCQWVGARLPSESEWEYAASSGGQDNSNPWGDEPNWCNYAVIGQTGAGCLSGCGTGHTWPVCGKHLGDTDQGLCNMMGNVWEMLGDSFHTDYNGAPADGSMWTTDIDPSWEDYRVKRGFSFSCYEVLMQCSNVVSARSATHKEYETVLVGFRCAR